MQRPLFSSSYSAKLIEQRYRVEGGTSAHDDWQQQQAQRTRTRQWVRKGVTARGEVWGILSDADSDTVVDEERVEDDDERVEGEGEDAETEKAEGAGSHGREYHDHAVSGISNSQRDAPAFSPSSPTTTTTDMAAKTYWWISLW